MDITLKIHVEPSRAGTPIWWAESDDLPGLTVSADTLAEMRIGLGELLDEFGAELLEGIGRPVEPIRIASERLVPAGAVAITQPGAQVVTEESEEIHRSVIQVLIPA